MDLELLQLKIKKSSKIYKQDYLSVVKTYQSLLNLPPLPNHMTVLQFIASVCHLYDIKVSDSIIKHFGIESDDSRRKEILFLMGNMRRKGLLGKIEFIKILFKCEFKLDLLRIANDIFSEDQGKSCLAVSPDELDLFKQYFCSGSIAQKKIALFFLVYLYDKTDLKINDIVMQALKQEKTQNIALDYILGLLTLEKEKNEEKTKIRPLRRRGNKGFDYGRFREEQQVIKDEKKKTRRNRGHQKKGLYDIVVETKSLEKTISHELKNANDDLYFSLTANTEIRKVIKEIEDPKAVINLLLSQVKERRDVRSIRLLKLKAISVIKGYFKISSKINDILFKMIDPSKEDLPIVMHILIRSVERPEIIGIINKINLLFCMKKDDDMRCYGLLLLQEIAFIDRSEKIMELLKEIAAEFRNSKVKGVFYAYCALMRAIKYGVTDKNSIKYLQKRKKILDSDDIN